MTFCFGFGVVWSGFGWSLAKVVLGCGQDLLVGLARGLVWVSCSSAGVLLGFGRGFVWV